LSKTVVIQSLYKAGEMRL